ncbi:arginase family protein [Legionella parisiensis]|uniref:Agmatinase n=1 Tax=Legionella parisiensis TaxID=45071 RepID=A0A1E5JLR6_9GAMM|nr:arginase family protein [Legionella parisiensis]KTD41325.1 formimidoylglutamase [Legionella parisiensis]OEH45485.1 Agmatinase [Legionella parisiensis]STX76374.1 formimidoylglutamase [Legionella parisiensis]
MAQLNYATCLDYEKAKAVIFGVNTQCAGTAPTFSCKSKQTEFSADFIRTIDNRLYSLPENFKSGDALWDAGNLEITDHTLANEIEIVSTCFYELIRNNKKPICLGGDHIIKYAAMKALDQVIPKEYGVIYLDAHPDCEAQDTLSYSSILHHGFLLPSLTPRQIMLMGIRQFTESEASALSHYHPDIGVIMGSEFYNTQMEVLSQKIITQFSGLKYLYLSIDLDGLNPACAPAVESPYPGGPDINQILYLLHILHQHFTFIGMDISELIPELDHTHSTALSAARILKEFYSVA